MHFLTTEQIREICIIARRAYEGWEGRADWEERNDHLSRTKCFDAWRHLETAKVTGDVQSLKHCIDERDYLPLLAHFADLAGEGGRALKALLRHQEEGRIRVFFKLQQVLAERGLEEGYAAHIARCKYKCDLGDCSKDQLWTLFFDIKKRKAKADPRPAPTRIEAHLGTVSVAGRKRVAKPAALSVAHLQACLARAVEAENYEEAARLRDLIAAQGKPAAVAGPF